MGLYDRNYRHVANERGLDVVVDSAGTAAYHVSEPPDERYALLK